MATLQDPDPFADPAFLDRFGKLLPMLGSGQANEADTARRKLLEHLGHHRLTLTDVATRLRRPPQAPAAPARSAGEAELTRELDLVRHAQRASEQMARSALQQNAQLQNRASRAESAQLAAQVQRRGERIAMFSATALAVGLLAIVVLDHMPGRALADDGAASTITATMQPTRPPLAAPDAPGLQAMVDGERLGSVLSHDIAVRADPAPESRIVGFLAHGTAVVVVREAEANGVKWVLVRSTVGAGYVPASSVAFH